MQAGGPVKTPRRTGFAGRRTGKTKRRSERSPPGPDHSATTWSMPSQTAAAPAMAHW
jgi:hypothetical protein